MNQEKLNETTRKLHRAIKLLEDVRDEVEAEADRMCGCGEKEISSNARRISAFTHKAIGEAKHAQGRGRTFKTKCADTGLTIEPLSGTK